MNLKPSENTQLYGMSNFFKEITTLYKENKMPTKILLSGKKGLGKSTLAYHIINYILSNTEDFKYNSNKLTINSKNRSFKLIKNNSHPNFYLIDLSNDKKNIDIAQIRQMITYTNKSSFNNISRFILIDNIENLNKNSVNALLKVTEEPNENIFFILVNNSEKYILPTLSSRCLTFKINLTFDQSINIANHLLNENIFELLNNDLINYYAKPGDYISLVNFSKENQINLNEFNLKKFLLLLIEENYYKKNNFVKLNIFNYIELYFLKIFNQSTNKSKISSFYTKFINKINYANKFNLDYESLFMEFKSKILNG